MDDARSVAAKALGPTVLPGQKEESPPAERNRYKHELNLLTITVRNRVPKTLPTPINTYPRKHARRAKTNNSAPAVDPPQPFASTTLNMLLGLVFSNEVTHVWHEYVLVLLVKTREFFQPIVAQVRLHLRTPEQLFSWNCSCENPFTHIFPRDSYPANLGMLPPSRERIFKPPCIIGCDTLGWLLRIPGVFSSLVSRLFAL